MCVCVVKMILFCSEYVRITRNIKIWARRKNRKYVNNASSSNGVSKDCTVGVQTFVSTQTCFRCNFALICSIMRITCKIVVIHMDDKHGNVVCYNNLCATVKRHDRVSRHITCSEADFAYLCFI